LNSFYGIKVVEKFVESAVIHIVGIELGLVQTKKTQLELQNQENENPIFAFNRLIYTNNGTIDTTSQDAPNRSWQIKITAKLNSTSLLFSHSRIGQSKQKAKTEAAKDILNFLAQRPDIYEQLQQPGDSMAEVHTLPISEEDYYHLTPVTAISTDNLFQQPRQQQQQQQQQQEQQQQLQNQQRTLNTTDWAGGDPSNIHISYTDDEDAIQLMSNLLLNGNSGSVDVEMSDESPTKKRQRQSIFSPFCDPVARDNNDDNSRTPFMPVPSSSAPPSDQHPVIKTEDSASAILAALHQPPPLPPTPRSPVTYIKNEEELNMFNQPFIAPVYNEKVVAFFKKIFIPHRHLLIQTLDMPGQSKSVFLSLAVQHQDIVHVDVKAQQGGPSHGPVFNALVTLRSKLKPQVFLKTEGMAKRKKDAEQMAFSKLIQLLK
jgi:hypothetical protein